MQVSMNQIEDDAHLWVQWDTYHAAINQLALNIYQTGWKFDQILCLARGGLRVGDQLSRIFNCPLAVLATSSYRSDFGMQQEQLNIASHVSKIGEDLAGKILLADDLVDSGVTLKEVQKLLLNRYKNIKEIRSAVIWYKARSIIRPDYFVKYLSTNPWIHQPFEDWDEMEPSQLVSSTEKTPIAT